MSANIVKLIDASIIPAALMVSSKLVGVISLIIITQVEWTLRDFAGSFFTTQPAVALEHLGTISTYSDLFLILIMTLATGAVLYRSIFLHAHHISPQLLARLAQHNLLQLVGESFTIFYHGSLWTIFHWLTTLTIFINTLQGKTSWVIAAIAILISIANSVLLLRGIVQEVSYTKRNLGTLSVY